MTSGDTAALLLTATHTHIGDAAFDMDREAVLARAGTAGIGTVITLGEALADARKNIALARQYPILKAAAGLYPPHLDQAAAEYLKAFIAAGNRQSGSGGLTPWCVMNPLTCPLPSMRLRRS